LIAAMIVAPPLRRRGRRGLVRNNALG